jgi:hypothetical protein
MEYFENDNRFSPYFTAAFTDRFDKLKTELEYCADTRYKLYFDIRTDEIDYKVITHRLWHYLYVGTGKDGGQPIAVIYLKQHLDLPDAMIDSYENILMKHFKADERHPVLRTIYAPSFVI